ncbi:MAG TPA: alpha/beta hydrolase [Burkholderiaceae bacterium]|nr:alpha/beta hydrolase [Burkholderiaceae bacterium]
MPTQLQFVELPWAGRRVRIEVLRVASGSARADSPTIVFLHEGLGSVAMWRNFPQRVCDAAGAHGIVYSRPGYGRSTPRDSHERWGLDFMHRQAHELLPALLDALHVDRDARPPWLLGHSDGASIALLHAARFPRQVGGLVVMAPHLFVEDLSIASIQQARHRYEQTDLRQKLARYHDDPDSAFWGWNDIWLHPPFAHWNIETEIATIACPLLAMQGVDDEYGTLEQIHAIARRVPHAVLVELPQCGHSPHRDQTLLVIDQIARFIDRALAPRSQRTEHQPAA